MVLGTYHLRDAETVVEVVVWIIIITEIYCPQEVLEVGRWYGECLRQPQVVVHNLHELKKHCRLVLQRHSVNAVR